MKNFINDKLTHWIEEHQYTFESDWTIEIKADGDISINKISCDDLTKISPLIFKIINFKPYTVLLSDEEGEMNWEHTDNFACGDCRRIDLNQKSIEELYGDDWTLKMFCGLINIGNGIHEIQSIEIYPSISKLRLL